MLFQVRDWTWESLREADPMIQEEASDDEDTEEKAFEGPQSFDEKQTFAKELTANLPTPDLSEGGVVEIGTGR